VNSSAEPKRARHIQGLDTRELAARIVDRVCHKSSYLSLTLAAELDRHPQLTASDRHLVTELCYGVIRTHRALIAQLERHVPRTLNQKDGMVLSHLLIAAYQLLVLDRVPDFAAVDSAVSGVRKLRGAKIAGFVNALLRRVAESKARVTVAGGLLKTAPDWLQQRLESCVGGPDALALLGIVGEAGARHFEAPPACVRVIAGRAAPAWLQDAPASRWVPGAYTVSGYGDLRQRGADFTVQEEGAQILGWLVGAQPGERILDACAGRGNKSLLLAERVGTEGRIFAADLYASKLETLSEHAHALGLSLETASVDWTEGVGTVPDSFDRVLVDAPCTGVGTLRRRPEILLRLKPEDPERMATMAVAILRNAASRVRASGRVVFAVCSVLPEECEGVLARVADILEPVPFEVTELSSLIPPGSTALRLLPRVHGTDGYFVANLRLI